jgi:four helix bundle protein
VGEGKHDLEHRTKRFALRVIKVVQAINGSSVGRRLGDQLLRAGTSVGANYREARRGSSTRHFITLLEIAQREASEAEYWLELIGESGVLPTEDLAHLRQEAHELLLILSASARTAKQSSK